MVKTGLDLLTVKRYPYLKKLRLGLMVNASSVDHRLQHAIEILIRRGFNITTLFSPEHGLWGSNQDQVKEGHAIDKQTGLKVYSLYRLNKKPTPGMLQEVDGLVYDIQDTGTRYYTFIWTMALGLEACAETGKKLIVLDRPNPLGGICREGPVLDMKYKSFVGLYPIPIRHGLTAGELARFLQGKFLPHADLEVIRMQGWKRKMWFDQTGLPWVMPSPNMPTLETAIVYPGMCLVEGTILSEGRGTTRPFELFGAPWIDPHQLAAALKPVRLPGVSLRPNYFKPTFNKFRSRECGGLQLHVTDRDRFRSLRTATAILQAIWKLYPKKTGWRQPPYEDERKLMPIDILAGNAKLRRAIEKGTPLSRLVAEWQADIRKFQKEVRPYLIYR